MIRLRVVRRPVATLPLLAALRCGGGDLVLPPGGASVGASPSRSTVTADPATIEPQTGVATVTVTVRDSDGNPVDGLNVGLHASGSDVDLKQPSDSTGADGIATGSMSSATPGTKIVSATVDDTVEVNQTAQVTVMPGPAPRPTMGLLEGTAQSAPAGLPVPIPPAVRLTNGQGQPVPGVAVSFVVTGGGGSVDGADQTTDSDGVARVGGWVLGPATGLNTLEARADSVQGSPVIFAAQGTASSSAVDHFVFQIQPQEDLDKDQALSMQVALADAAGNVVPLNGVVIYVELFREGEDHPSNTRVVGDRFRETQNGAAVFDLRVTKDDDDYRFRALSDDLPQLGPVFSRAFDVD
jgi:hypothetical protein